MKRLVTVLTWLMGAAVLTAAGAPTGVSDLIQRGLAGNPDILRARTALQTAKDALPWASQLPNTKATLSGSYDTAAGASGAAKGTASVDIPIVPQLSLGATVSSEGSAGASLTVSPFAAPLPRYKETQAYEDALTDLTYQTASLGYGIEAAAYALAQATATLQTARDQYDLKQRALDIAQKAYDIEGITWDDLEQARADLTDARQAMYDAERASLDAELGLYRLVGPTGGEPAVADVSLEELEAAIASRDAQIASAGDASQTPTLAKARSALKALEAQLDATPTYRPALTLGARLSYASAQGLGASGSIGFTFSPNDVGTDERSNLQMAITAGEMEVQAETLAAAYQARVATRALEVAKAALEGRTDAVRQAVLALQEAQVLLEQGQRTEVEVTQTRLDLDKARIAQKEAAAAVLSAQGDVLLLHVL